ncbi:MAG: hypothetical protein BIFFINMI_02963 [Phycisphaerae bacterium]|nr:hypothetical protein [Phycisphaerae bacterium]
MKPYLLALLLAAILTLPSVARADEPTAQPQAAPTTQPQHVPTTQPARRVKVPDVTAEQFAKMTPQQKVLVLRQAEVAMAAAAIGKDFAAAEEAARKLVELMPEQANFHYALAGMLALQHKDEAALDALADAVGHGLSDAYQVLHSKAFEPYVGNERFKNLVVKMRAADKEAADKAYEKPGAAQAGVKVVEGDPQDGLRWRLYVSAKADKEHPQKLAIWLHPAGASSNAQVEHLLVPLLTGRGFCLLMPTAMNWANWTTQDAQRLQAVSVPDAAKTEGVDAAKPMLIGFSAGGQLALQLYRNAPGNYGGLVLDAAYPLAGIQRGANGQNRVSIFLPPANDAVRSCPVFSLVGERDNGLLIWTEAEDRWRKQGVPLTLIVVKGAAHEWLFGDSQRARLADWLDQVAAGKMPGVPTTQPANTPPGEGEIY